MKEILKKLRLLARPGIGLGLLIAVLLLGGCGADIQEERDTEQEKGTHNLMTRGISGG